VDHLLDDFLSLQKVVDVNALFLFFIQVVTDYGKDIQHFNLKYEIIAFVGHLLDDFLSLQKVVDVNALFLFFIQVVTDYGKDIQHFNLKIKYAHSWINLLMISCHS
jgi:hypothetical protein